MPKMKKDNSLVSNQFYQGSYYFSTNNVSLRSYLSHDSIYANSILESSNTSFSPGNLFDDFLLIADKYVADSENNTDKATNETTYPIVIEIQFGNKILSDTKIYICDKGYYLKLDYLQNFNPIDHYCCLILGMIPFQCVKQIFFRNDEEMDRFQFAMHNIEYPKEIFIADDNKFLDSKKLHLNKIGQSMDYFEKSTRMEIGRAHV